MTFLLFKRYFFSKRSGAVIRSMARICTVASFIGVFALIVVSSIMEGFNLSIRNKLVGVDPHLTVSVAEDIDPAWVEGIQSSLSQNPGREINPFAKQDVIIRTLEGHFSGAIAKGLSNEALYRFLERAMQLRYKSGAAPSLTAEETSLGQQEVIMGADLARSLNLFEGDEFLMIPPESFLGPAGEAPKFERMRLKSVVTTEFPEVDSRLILYQLSSKTRRFESPMARETGIEIRIAPNDDLVALMSSVKKEFPDLPLKFETWAERNRALFSALKLERFAMSTFLILSVLITCFSPIALLSMLISQKRKEIGLLMSIGLSKARIQKLFLVLGLLLAGSGLFLGLASGVLVSQLLHFYPIEILPDIYYDTVLPSVINYDTVLYVFIFCCVMAFFAAFVPVKQLVIRQPADNLRQTEG